MLFDLFCTLLTLLLCSVNSSQFFLTFTTQVSPFLILYYNTLHVWTCWLGLMLQCSRPSVAACWKCLARRCVNAGPFSCMYPQSTRSIVVPTLHTYSNLKGALKPATVQSQSRAYSTWAGSRLLFPDLLVLSLTLTRLVARVVMLYLLGKVAYSGTEHGCERVSHALILSPCFISYMSRSIVDEEFLYWRFRQFPGCDYFGNTRQSIC